MKVLLNILVRRFPLLFAYRGNVATGYLRAPFGPFVRSWYSSLESTNFTYHLEPYNRRCMVAMLWQALGHR